MPQPRSWSSLGLFSPLDGNLLGGLLFGAGAALASACPGMALPQLALGHPPARAAVAGACVGGLVWSAILRPLVERRRRSLRGGAATISGPSTTPGAALGLSRGAAFLLYEAALWAAVTKMAPRVAPPSSSAGSPLTPVLGGVLVGGGAQLVSLGLRGSLLGVSTCYEQLGDWGVYAVRRVVRGRRRGAGARPGTSALVFAASVVAGAWLLARARPDLVVAPSSHDYNYYYFHYYRRDHDPYGRSFAGGFLMAVGSRAAGGCAAGHGISGMALMSMSSVVTMAAACAAAVGVARMGA